MYRSVVVYYEEIFWLLALTKFGIPESVYFRRLQNSTATSTANIYGEERDRDNRETELETTRGPLHRFMNVGPLTAKNKTLIFTHPSKFCVFLYCRASHTQFSRQNSTKLCHMVGVNHSNKLP